jgi:hypothetical protein
LPFIAAFDAPEPSSALSSESAARASKGPQKRVTYVALAKVAMPLLVDVYLKHQHEVELYKNGTVETILGVSGPRLLKLHH